MTELPVVVVGAGPVGLAAAAELAERGVTPVVVERGPVAGAAVTEWSHVRLFSRWPELVAPAARRLLEPRGWTLPEGDYPTGGEWVRDYLTPLADALGSRVRYGAEVTGVDRQGEVFTVHPRAGEPVAARAVIDASGTWGQPNPLGDGRPAEGEAASADRIAYRIPDRPARYAGRHVVVAGSGHSALTALVALAGVAARITWLLRRGVGAAFGGGEADELPARGALGLRANAAVDAGHVTVVTGFRTAAVERHGARVDLVSDTGERVSEVDEVLALTGFRPDLSWLAGLRLDLDPTLLAPVALAPLIDPAVHSCGTVYPHGVREVAQPEPGLFLAGMKSYGRAPTFLALTGYEQVRSVAAHLAGDHEAAGRVELVLPETGVCGGIGT